MSSKGYIKIPESQLRLERRIKHTNKTWHNNIMNLLLGKNVCGSCLRLDDDLVHWDAEFVLLRYEYDTESSLKNIMISTFGASVINIIPTTNFCQKCVDIILSAYLLLCELRNNCSNIQRKLMEISQQMKWTNYLDETGSLTEIINNKINFDENSKAAPNNNHSHATNRIETDPIKNSTEPMEKDVKTHKIVLNNESLKSKLLLEPDMHKFLIEKDELSPKKLTEQNLPAGITVRKIKQCVDMSDFAPHDLLELDWAEDEANSITDPQVPSNKLHSNEALIMNLMEKAKTVEKQIYFQENLKLKANEFAKLPVADQNPNDSLSVKLIERGNTNETYSDNDDLVPQDLLELKWPAEEQTCNMIHQTKIPVKKLNFNEALTVKFIPSKLNKVQDSVNEMAPHELLELNWNEEVDVQNTNMTPNETDKKHSIDLTQWLQDQGMSTIKSKLYTHNNTRISNLSIDEEISKKNKPGDNSNKEVSDALKNKFSGILFGMPKTDTVNDLIKCNVVHKNSLKDLDNNAIRCALCNLSFNKFESYWSHYKTHNITEAAKCYRCSAEFQVIELLVEHLLLMHSETMAYCTLCYALLKQNKVAQHMVNHHAKKVEIINAGSSVQSSFCNKCNRSYTNLPDSPHVCVFHAECTECKQDCIHTKYLTAYIDQIKANCTVFKCTDCEYQYKTKQDIIRHANYAHLKHKSHICKICQARFSLHVDLANHSDTYHFRCRGCRKVFTGKNALDNHICPKLAPKEWNCEMCGEKFIDLKFYGQHKQTALAVNDECVVCHSVIPNKCNMARHMQIVHNLCMKNEDNTMLYACTICQTDFKNEIDFKQHICLYECRICTKRFSIKGLYEKHLQAHSDVTEALKCSVCSLQLIDKYALSHHMVCHTDYEKCPVCFNYIEKRILQQHLKCHDDPKDRLKCPHCTLICENQNQFEVHVNRFHLLKRPFQCDLCKKSFYGKHKLREHIRLHSAEARPRLEKCTVCSKKFARKITLEKHMKLHSTGQIYECDVCLKRYISSALLHEHRKSHKKYYSNLPKPETSQNRM